MPGNDRLEPFLREIPEGIREKLGGGEEAVAIVSSGLGRDACDEAKLVLTSKRLIVLRRDGVVEQVSLSSIKEHSLEST